MEREHCLSALLQLNLHSRLKTWLQWIGQRQLEHETRNIKVLGFGETYIRGLTSMWEQIYFNHMHHFNTEECRKYWCSFQTWEKEKQWLVTQNDYVGVLHHWLTSRLRSLQCVSNAVLYQVIDTQYLFSSRMIQHTNSLTHCGLVAHYGDIGLGQHWLR